MKMDINLNKYTRVQLAEIYSALNGWEWHKLLGEKPYGYDEMLDYHPSKEYKLETKQKIISPIMREINKRIGDKECMRWWHINELNKSNLEFELYWLKSNVQKFFGIGFYSKKTQKVIKQALTEIRDKNHEDNIGGRFK